MVVPVEWAVCNKCGYFYPYAPDGDIMTPKCPACEIAALRAEVEENQRLYVKIVGEQADVYRIDLERLRFKIAALKRAGRNLKMWILKETKGEGNRWTDEWEKAGGE